MHAERRVRLARGRVGYVHPGRADVAPDADAVAHERHEVEQAVIVVVDEQRRGNAGR
jgi:hypothetical protein